MNIHKEIAFLFIIFVTVLNAPGQNMDPTKNVVYQIQIGKTRLEPTLLFLGKADQLYKTHADGISSGHTSYKYMYRKSAIAITSVFYTPENGKNGLIQNLELVDTSKLDQYDNGGEVFLRPTLINIISLFGEPEKQNKSETRTELIYAKKEMIFTVDNVTNDLLILSFENKK